MAGRLSALSASRTLSPGFFIFKSILIGNLIYTAPYRHVIKVKRHQLNKTTALKVFYVN
jgi:hypothetical protein